MINLQSYQLPFGTVEIILCSQIGSYHTQNGLPNQDSIGVACNNEKIVVAVADGVGSCTHSDDGSSKAVSTVKNLINSDDMTDDGIISTVISEWTENIDYPIEDCHSTLHFVIVTEKEIILGGIGDGTKCILSHGQIEILHDDCGFSNCTFALPMIEQFEIQRYQLRTTLVAIMTDGVSNVLNPNSFKEFCTYLATSIQANASLLTIEIDDWVKSLQNINGDDKTIAIISLDYVERDCNE